MKPGRNAPRRATTAKSEQPLDGALPRLSVIITVRNEEKLLGHLLDSLAPQRHLAQVIVVDAMSADRTAEVARRHGASLPGFQLLRQSCRRGEGRNLGAAVATGDLLCFIDGDCIANAFWTERLVAAHAAAGSGAPTIVAGATRLVGFWAFTKLSRVELAFQGQDTSWPSCNLLYPKALFDELGGFDGRFVTAEDIDLNYRAAAAGARIVHAEDAIVYAQARDSITGFLRQAYWNGYGRKQLTLKHGKLWAQYSLGRMLRTNGASFWGLLRMAWGFFGYMAARRRKGLPSSLGATGGQS